MIQPQSSQPSASNVMALTQQCALHKKLCPEQHDELDAFLSVSFFMDISHRRLHLNVGQDTALGQHVQLFAHVLALENKVNAIQVAAPLYQLSDELKLCIMT